MKKFLLPFLFILVFIATESCKKKDACDNVSCNGGGVCVDGTCQCDSLHEGTNCETDKRAKYFGSFVGNANCTSLNHLDYLKITAVSDSANQLNFHNLYGSERNIVGIIFSDGSVYIPEQVSGLDTISGSASINNGKVVVNYTAKYPGGTDVCSWMQKW